MPMLKALQETFFNAILDKDAPMQEAISSNYAQERFLIYRNNIQGNLCNTLKVTFPGIWQLLGEECAESVAKAFVSKKAAFPNSGCLDDWGESFPQFLSTLEALKSIPYITDYALYEWNKQLAYNAISSKSALEATGLSIVSEEMLNRLRVYFTPCTLFFQSSFPLDQVENMLENQNGAEISLENRSSYCIISRHNESIYSYWIEQGLFEFLKVLHSGKTLEEASLKVVSTFEDFDIVQAIFFMISKKLLSHYIVAEVE